MYFKEEQHMKHSVKWYILTGVIAFIVIFMIILLATEMQNLPTPTLIMTALMPVLMIGVWMYLTNLALYIKVDQHGLSYQVPPFFGQWKNVPKRDIVSFKVEGGNISTAMKLHSKHKIRWIGKHKRFIVLGKDLLTLELKENRKLILSTKQPQQLKEAMAKLMEH